MKASSFAVVVVQQKVFPPPESTPLTERPHDLPVHLWVWAPVDSYPPLEVVPAHWYRWPLLRRLVSIILEQNKNRAYTASEKAAMAVQKTWTFILELVLKSCSRRRRLLEYRSRAKREEWAELYRILNRLFELRALPSCITFITRSSPSYSFLLTLLNFNYIRKEKRTSHSQRKA